MNTLAVAAQFSLAVAFLGGTFIKLFALVDDDSASERPLVITLVVFNVGVLILFTALSGYQLLTGDALPHIHLVSTGQPPQQNLQKGGVYHIFLSHMHAVPTPLPETPVDVRLM